MSRKFRSVEQIREKYFPDTVEAERLGIESPSKYLLRIYAEIFCGVKREDKDVPV